MNKLKFLITFLACSSLFSAAAQTRKATAIAQNLNSIAVERPKLMVGIVVDQMRWDYLYRFYSRYGDGGFKRLLGEGFSVENTFIPYTPTKTACGHSSIYTGSVPAINGIIGNDWYDPIEGRNLYCTEDKSVKTVGSTSSAGEMSPRNMLTTTITDELRLATNFKSKVIGISLKDRGSILPAGHTANAAYWFDGKTGNWITSTYYMDKLPKWVDDFNNQRMPNKYFAQNWNTLYPINTYTESVADDNRYESPFSGEKMPTFPHNLEGAINKDFDLIKSVPYGNTLTLSFAKEAIDSEKLGANGTTDFLAVSCSSTDYIGHRFAPNSVEIEDTYLRLDKDIEDFLNYLDKKLGKGNYTVFLTADHAGAHNPNFLKDNKVPAGTASVGNIAKGLNSLLEKQFNIKKPILTSTNYQIYFNHQVIDSAKIDFDALKKVAVNYLNVQEGVQSAIDLTNIGSGAITEPLKTMVINGYNARRSGDIFVVFQPGWFDGSSKGTNHGTWNPYDAHIPLVFMGWGIKHGATNTTHYMTDIAATIAALLHIQMPSGCIGQPITEITNK